MQVHVLVGYLLTVLMGYLHIPIKGALSQAWENLYLVDLDELGLALVYMDGWTTLVGFLKLSDVSVSAILAKIDSDMIFFIVEHQRVCM